MADNMECGGEKLLTESGLKYMLKKMTGKILLAVGVIRAEGDAPLTLWREETDDGITVRGSVDLSSCATADGLANEVSAREGADDALRTAIDGKQDAGNYATKDEIPDVSGLVTKTDADNDYASKDDTYTKSEVDDLVKNAEAGGDVDLSGYQRKLSYYSEGNQWAAVGGASSYNNQFGCVEVDMTSGFVGIQTGASGSKEHELKLANDGSLMLDGDKVLTEADVEDSLTSTATNRALSANQGYVLNHSKQDKLTAGENITISDDNVISAAGGDVDLSGYATIKNVYSKLETLGVLTKPTIAFNSGDCDDDFSKDSSGVTNTFRIGFDLDFNLNDYATTGYLGSYGSSNIGARIYNKDGRVMEDYMDTGGEVTLDADDGEHPTFPHSLTVSNTEIREAIEHSDGVWVALLGYYRLFNNTSQYDSIVESQNYLHVYMSGGYLFPNIVDTIG